MPKQIFKKKEQKEEEEDKEVDEEENKEDKEKEELVSGKEEKIWAEDNHNLFIALDFSPRRGWPDMHGPIQDDEQSPF